MLRAQLFAVLHCALADRESRESCLAAFNAEVDHFRDLSAVMAQDHNWDILHRRGEVTVCLEEGHRFFFALFFYQQYGAPAATADFAACLPRECDPVYLPEDVLPKMYHHFFEYHMHVLEDGTVDESKSLQYSITVKEYKGLRVSVNVSQDIRDFQWSAFIGAIVVLPGLAVTLLWELPQLFRKWPERPKPLIVRAFSLREGCQELVSVDGISSDLCWLRVSYVVGLIVLHVTQGSKWRCIDVLESSHWVFAAVRPLAMVNDAFIQLSAYLCACSDAKAKASVQTKWATSIRMGLNRSWKKYLRQLPVCLFWSWFYLSVLPSVPYNPYNHAFPWFGIRWYHATAKCMKRKWRYSFLLGDVAAVFFRDADADWWMSNGNPCVNLWNFQLEIQAFTLTTCILALGPPSAPSIFVLLVAFGFGATAYADAWWLHHARGISLQMLVLSAVGFAVKPMDLKWRHLRWLGVLSMVTAMLIHGISRGGWGEILTFQGEILGLERLKLLKEKKLLATGLWQIALAFGTAMLCEGCRANRKHATPWLAAGNRLAFGMNVAHPFVQFFVEAHSSLNDRVFSLFSWPTHLALIFTLTAIPAALVYIFVQRPWALLLQYAWDAMVLPKQATRQTE